MEDGPDFKVDPRRSLPAVDRLVREVSDLAPELPAWAVTAGVREALAAARAALGEGRDAPDAASLAEDARRRALGLASPHPRRVVNATGVVLHTNLGRAVLAPGAAAAAAEAAAGYSDLELELASGRRGDRLQALRALLEQLSGAESAHAVNNNAAALLLALDSLGRGREVIVSRGELVEIGGSFRVPDIMERAGVRLVEVGTTNRTHLRDYRDAIGPETALLLKVHRSNFAQSGFVTEVELPELAALGREHALPVVEDLGSGTLVDLRERGLPRESYAPDRLALGADVVCFSGDKLLGGPQAGILLGAEAHLAAMRKNPLARALRLDKLSLAALDWTLRALLAGRAEELPVLEQLLASPARLEARARGLAERLEKAAGDAVRVAIGATRSPVGGGSLPGFELDTWVVELRPRNAGCDALARGLRGAPLPVLVRVRDDALLLDVRTLLADDDTALEAALLHALRDTDAR